MVYKDFLSSAHCDVICKTNQEWVSGSTAGETQKHRIVETADVHKYYRLRSMVGRQIVEHNVDYKYDVQNINEMRMLRYKRGGKYDWHQDVDWSQKQQRKFTFIIQLTDPEMYTGGDLEFRDADIDLSHTRERGSLIIFPSMLYHRITPIKKGIRQSIVGWAVGPRWK